MAIWVIKYGQREGPYEEQDVRELLYEGTYNDADPAIRDGQLDWTTLGLLLGHYATRPVPAPPPLPEASSSAEPPDLPTPATVEEEVMTPEPDAPYELPPEIQPEQPITIRLVDFDIPFRSIFLLMLKWIAAGILATLCIGAVAGILLGLLSAAVAMLAR